MFFDIDGAFVCRAKASTNDAPNVLTNEILDGLVITENSSTDLTQIRNVVKVWGKCLDTDYFTENVTYDSGTNTYTAKFNDIAINTDGTLPTSAKFAVKIPSANEKDSPKLKIYSATTGSGTNTEKLIDTYEITNSLEENIKKETLIKNASFVFRYRRGTMYLLGQWQIVAINILMNRTPTKALITANKEKYGCDDISYTISPLSPFSVEKLGEQFKQCEGGEYDNIQAIDDCITRAEYECWLSSRLHCNTTIETIMIPWLIGNEKVLYTLKSNAEEKVFIVTGISISVLNCTSVLTLSEFYPQYNFDIE